MALVHASGMLKRTVGPITIQREGNGLETQWGVVGPAGQFDFAANAEGALQLTEAGLTQAGVVADQREALFTGIWDFTPAEVRSLTVDGNAVRTR